MRTISTEQLPFEREEVPVDEAIERFRTMGQDYKVELLSDLKERGTTRIASREDADVDPERLHGQSLPYRGLH